MEVRKGRISSFFHIGTKWVLGEWRQAVRSKGMFRAPECDIGIHVYVDRARALVDIVGETPASGGSPLLLAEVEVDGFIASGDFDLDQSETWQKAKIIRLFDVYDHEVTSEYAPIPTCV